MSIAFMDANELSPQSLTAASLYFDRVIVLVPRTDEPFPFPAFPIQRAPWRNSLQGSFRELYQDLEDLGILREVPLSRDLKRRVATPLVDAIAQEAKYLRKVARFDRAWPIDEGVRTYTIAYPFFPDVLREVVTQEGLGFYKANAYHAGAYVRTISMIGRVYFSALYEAMAKSNMAAVVSEKHSPFSGASTWTSDKIREILLSSPAPYAELSSDLAAGLVGMASVNAVIPTEALAASRIDTIRSRHRAELSLFQNFVEGLRYPSDVDAYNSDSLRELVSVKYEREVYPGLENLRATIREQKINAVWGALSVKTALPPIVGSVVGASLPLGPLTSAVSAGVGVALGLGEAAYQAVSNLRNTTRENSHSYLLSLEKSAAGRALERHRTSGPPPKLGGDD